MSAEHRGVAGPLQHMLCTHCVVPHRLTGHAPPVRHQGVPLGKEGCQGATKVGLAKAMYTVGYFYEVRIGMQASISVCPFPIHVKGGLFTAFVYTSHAAQALWGTYGHPTHLTHIHISHIGLHATPLHPLCLGPVPGPICGHAPCLVPHHMCPRLLGPIHGCAPLPPLLDFIMHLSIIHATPRPAIGGTLLPPTQATTHHHLCMVMHTCPLTHPFALPSIPLDPPHHIYTPAPHGFQPRAHTISMYCYDSIH